MARAMAVGRAALANVVLLAISSSLLGCSDDYDDDGGEDPAFDLLTEGLRSISYGPMYLRSQSCIGAYDPSCSAGFVTDDFASQWAEPIWGKSGRGDLANIAGLGCNAVRLYGNDPRFPKHSFLDEARSHRLQVIEGLSTYLYNDPSGPNCAMKGSSDCHDAVQESFSSNLYNGLLTDDGRYHSALAMVNIANEPDFFFKPGMTPLNYIKALVTAFDGLLTAEKKADVRKWGNGKLPLITTTWSFATRANNVDVCKPEYFIHDQEAECGPALTFMVQFYRAVKDPLGTISYTPRNDLWTAYKQRWINGVNVFVQAEAIFQQLISKYEQLPLFQGIRLFSGEWNAHQFYKSPEELMSQLLELDGGRSESPFIGVSYFQYQVAYNKDGEERKFGLFELGDKIIGETQYITSDPAHSHPVNCLKPTAYVQHLMKAWRGTGVKRGLCPPAPARQEIEQTNFTINI